MTLNLRRTNGPTDKKVFLAGEGANDLGGWHKETIYRDEVPYPGVLETLLRNKKAEGWMVIDAIKWQYIRNYRAGDHGKHDEQNVRRVCLMAKEKGCDVIALCRDSDGHTERVADIQKGIESAHALWSDKLGIIGGCAIPCIEGWVCAIMGITDTEASTRKKVNDHLTNMSILPKDTAAMVEKIEQTGLENIAEDAHSLKSWLDIAGQVL
jgi:hypothetical protein